MCIWYDIYYMHIFITREKESCKRQIRVFLRFKLDDWPVDRLCALIYVSLYVFNLLEQLKSETAQVWMIPFYKLHLLKCTNAGMSHQLQNSSFNPLCHFYKETNRWPSCGFKDNETVNYRVWKRCDHNTNNQMSSVVQSKM